MYRQVRTTPRKRPRQARSIATVDAILDATARVLVKQGFDGLTTNHVAETAGVSVGSVYQYFPNKEALVGALIEQLATEMNRSVVAELARVATLPVAQAVRAMIELTIRAYSVNPAVHRVLIEQVPRVGRLAKIAELQLITFQIVAALLEARKHELAIANPETSAFVLVAAIEAIATKATLFQPERLRDPTLVDETTTMVTRYLGIADE